MLQVSVAMQVTSTASAQLLALPARANVANADNQKAPEFLKTLINVELSFVKRVCKPTDEQMDRIVDAAAEAHSEMDDILRGARVAGRIVRRQQRVRMNGPNNEQLVQNPYERVRDDVAKCVKQVLTDDQYERYLEEATERSRFEKQAAVEITLGLIDDKVALTPQQHEQLSKRMMADWEGVDIQQMQMYLNNPQYVPSVAKQFLSGVLTAKQMTAWNTHRAVSFTTRITVPDDSDLSEAWIK